MFDVLIFLKRDIKEVLESLRAARNSCGWNSVGVIYRSEFIEQYVNNEFLHKVNKYLFFFMDKLYVFIAKDNYLGH